MTPEDLPRLRMRSQRLWASSRATPVDVVGRMAAMQAQEFVPAQWAIAQRMGGDEGNDAYGDARSEIERAFAAGEILRTHLLRPTWHFVRGADIHWLLGLVAPRVHLANGYYYRKFEVDDELGIRARRLLERWLSDETALTRPEIAARLDADGISASGLRLGYILMRAELDGVIASGPPDGRAQRYALLDERVPPASRLALDGEEALAELTRRYVRSRGAATAKDLSSWSGLTVRDARRGFELLGDEAREVGFGEWRCWVSAESMTDGARPTDLEPASPRVDLLQGYDEYFSSYSESRGVSESEGGAGAMSGGSASGASDEPPGTPPFLHAIVLNGRIIGRWRHTLRARVARVEIQLHRPLTTGESDALTAAVDRLGAFFGVRGEVAPDGIS